MFFFVHQTDPMSSRLCFASSKFHDGARHPPTRCHPTHQTSSPSLRFCGLNCKNLHQGVEAQTIKPSCTLARYDPPWVFQPNRLDPLACLETSLTPHFEAKPYTKFHDAFKIFRSCCTGSLLNRCCLRHHVLLQSAPCG